MGLALLWRQIKPHGFEVAEANERFKRCLKRYGVVKGIKAHMILSITEHVLLFICVILASKWVFAATINQGIIMTLVLLIFFHIGGALTNLIAMIKKEPGVSNLNTVKGGKKV